MKIIFRIAIILLVAAIVAGGFFLAVNNTSLASSGPGGEGGRPAFSAQNSAQPPAGFEGGERDREGTTLGEGLLGMFGSLVKLGAIATLVLLLEKGVGSLKNRKLRQSRAG